MLIEFDPVKDAANVAKHGVSLTEAAQLDWKNALIWEDHRRDYGELRQVALAVRNERLYGRRLWIAARYAALSVCVKPTSGGLTVMKQKLIRPTETEDAAITAAALADADNPPLTEAELAQFKRAPGRPPGRKKVSTTVRFDADVLAAMKATGKGWQTRINDVVREWIKSHPGN